MRPVTSIVIVSFDCFIKFSFNVYFSNHNSTLYISKVLEKTPRDRLIKLISSTICASKPGSCLHAGRSSGDGPSLTRPKPGVTYHPLFLRSKNDRLFEFQ